MELSKVEMIQYNRLHNAN